ncbi:SGNH/GDSL hydrolase family protein [Aeoliella sp. ICT_H6.2]|uniref:SGNH/GDSL hydrolase family protein n=2 Tax=Aeoliella straminimaris TaxID=2954799 RepID=A0A9X2FEW0_9BACT|nr:SGNH/GDSL hydrolase family protein [Aeoliella straminimaris]
MFHRGLLACAVTLALLLGSDADAFSDLFVFGDSLSDVGNTDAATAWIPFGNYPGSAYYEGRFSNGQVYSELLSQQLGLGTLTRSSNGGDNFAYGGAKTSGSDWVTGLFLNDLGEQVADYVDNRTGDPEALYIVWAGANDLFDNQMNMSIPVGNITNDIQQLYDDGARQFLVMNLPKLGATPEYNGTAASQADWNNRTQMFNTTLASGLDDLEASIGDASIRRFDIEALFDQVLANPGDYGLTNVSESAAPDLEPGTYSYDNSDVVANPDEYLFWDNVHPTRVMHAHLADAIYEFLTTPEVLAGDFNGDSLVDLADYTVWRNNLGATDDSLINMAGDDVPGIDAGDYVVWKDNFGSWQPPTTSPSAPAQVPEPGGLVLVCLAVAMSYMGGHMSLLRTRISVQR